MVFCTGIVNCHFHCYCHFNKDPHDPLTSHHIPINLDSHRFFHSPHIQDGYKTLHNKALFFLYILHGISRYHFFGTPLNIGFYKSLLFDHKLACIDSCKVLSIALGQAVLFGMLRCARMYHCFHNSTCIYYHRCFLLQNKLESTLRCKVRNSFSGVVLSWYYMLLCVRIRRLIHMLVCSDFDRFFPILNKLVCNCFCKVQSNFFLEGSKGLGT